MKKIIMIVLSFCLLFFITGCNNSGDIKSVRKIENNNVYEDDETDYIDDNKISDEPIIGYWLAFDGTGLAISNSSIKVYSPYNGSLFEEFNFEVTKPFKFGYNDAGDVFSKIYNSNKYNTISVQDGYFDYDGSYIKKGEDMVLVLGNNALDCESGIMSDPQGGAGFQTFLRVDNENLLKGKKKKKFSASEEVLLSEIYGTRTSIYFEVNYKIKFTLNNIYVTYVNNMDEFPNTKDFENWKYSTDVIDYRFLYVVKTNDRINAEIITSDNKYMYISIDGNQGMNFQYPGLGGGLIENGGKKSLKKYLEELENVLN